MSDKKNNYEDPEFRKSAGKQGDQHVNTPSFTDLDDRPIESYSKDQRDLELERDSFKEAFGTPERGSYHNESQQSQPVKKESPPKEARKEADKKDSDISLHDKASQALAKASRITGGFSNLNPNEIKLLSTSAHGEIRTKEVLTKANELLKKTSKVGQSLEIRDEQEGRDQVLSEALFPSKSPIKTEKLVDSVLKLSQDLTRKVSPSPIKQYGGVPTPNKNDRTPTKGDLKTSQELKKSQDLARRLKETYGTGSNTKLEEVVKSADAKKPPTSPFKRGPSVMLDRSGTFLEKGASNVFERAQSIVMERNSPFLERKKTKTFYEELSPQRLGESPTRSNSVHEAFFNSLNKSEVVIKRNADQLKTSQVSGGGERPAPDFGEFKITTSQVFVDRLKASRSVIFENSKLEASTTVQTNESPDYIFAHALQAASPPGFFIPKTELRPVYVTEKLEDGSTYKGEKLKDLRHGNGELVYSDGSKYEGSWEFGKKNGYGVLKMLSGRVLYDGSWKDDIYHGPGILYNNQNQDVDGFDPRDFNSLENNWWKYEGDFVDGKKQGLGSLVMRNNEKFVGRFNLDKVHGNGTFHYNNGSSLAGHWEFNKLTEEF